MITTSERQKIFGLAKQLGLLEQSGEKDLLHDLIGSLTGKDSVKLLDTTDYKIVVKELVARNKLNHLQAPPKKATTYYTVTQTGMTAGQQKKVWYLMYQLQGCDMAPNAAALGDRLCGIIKRELHIDCTAKQPMRWLSYQQGNKLIETLKNYCRSAEQKVMRGG
jgi:hypothetical protein